MTALIRNVFMFAALVLMTAATALCCPQPPGYGYIIRSVFTDYTKGPFVVVSNQTGQTLGGNYVRDLSGAVGFNTAWQNATDNNGLVSQYGKRTPAVWDIHDITGFCSQLDSYAQPPYYEELSLQPSSDPQNHNCYRLARSIQVNPGVMYSGVYSTLTFSDTGIGTHGPLIVTAYDVYGNQVGHASASGVNADSCSVYWMIYATGDTNVWVTKNDGTGEGVGQFYLDVEP